MSDIAPPLWLLAELTYRCPLHCAFCYNPVNYTDHGSELSTDQWLGVLREARGLGAAQLGFSGVNRSCATIWKSWCARDARSVFTRT